MNKYIYIIDDDPEDVGFITEALMNNGYSGKAKVFYSGRKFIQNFKTDKSATCTAPDLVILDVNMHQASGFECLEHLRKLDCFGDVPVMFLSMSQVEEDLSKAREMSAVAYLYKPYSYKDYNRLGKAILDFLSKGHKENLSDYGKVFSAA